MIGDVLHVVYGLTLAFNMLWSTALMKLIYVLPFTAMTRQGLCLMLVQFSWRMALWLSPWVRCMPDSDHSELWRKTLDIMAADEKARAGKPARPLFILGNHGSFFDTILAVVAMPSKALWRCRTYMASHLFKLPILSTVCRSVGHFPVYFASDEDGNFKVDTTRMEEVEKKVNNHLAQGGWLCFFPEGQMNKNPDKMMPFRFGGLKKALEFDACLVSLVMHGNTKTWPMKAKVGGWPGQVRYSTRILAPEGCRAFVAKAREEGLEEEKSMADHEILAKRLHATMQAQYDALGSSEEAKRLKAD